MELYVFHPGVNRKWVREIGEMAIVISTHSKQSEVLAAFLIHFKNEIIKYHHLAYSLYTCLKSKRICCTKEYQFCSNCKRVDNKPNWIAERVTSNFSNREHDRGGFTGRETRTIERIVSNVIVTLQRWDYFYNGKEWVQWNSRWELTSFNRIIQSTKRKERVFWLFPISSSRFETGVTTWTSDETFAQVIPKRVIIEQLQIS